MNDQTKPQVHFSLGQKAAVFAPAAATAIGLDVVLHAPLPLAVAGVVGAGFLASKSPEFYEALRGHVPLPAMAQQKERKPGEWTFGDRLLGKHLNAPSQESVPAPHEAEPERDEQPEAPYAEAQRTMTAYELLASGTLGNDILLGYDKNGNEIRRTWKQLKAILILGLQGGGKTTTACWLMAQALSQGARLAVIDKHAKSEEDSMLQKIEPFMSFFDCHPGEDPESSLQVVRHVKRVFENRLDGAPCDYPLLLVVDEFSAIMAQASKDESRWQECAKELAALIEELNFEGRKHKVYAICIGQATNATRTGGTEIRDLFNTRIVHGMRTKQAQMLSLNEYAKDIRSLDLGQVIVDMEGRDEPFFAQVPYLSDKDIKAIAGRIGTPAMAHRLPDSGNLEDLLASNNLSVEDLLKLINKLPDVDPTDSRYTQPREQRAQHYYQPQTPRPAYERMPDLPTKTSAQQREEAKLERALQLWNVGHASVRKLEAASGWSNGETRRIIQVLKEKGLIYRDA